MSGPCSKVIIKINITLEIQNFDFFFSVGYLAEKKLLLRSMNEIQQYKHKYCENCNNNGIKSEASNICCTINERNAF
jgi:hypothetical protein